MKINGYLLKSTIVAALGGLLFGFDTAVIAGTTRSLAEVYRLSPRLLGLTVSSALWGTMLGAMLASVPGDRFGRRDSLRIVALLYVASALGCALAWNWNAVIFSRGIGRLAHWRIVCAPPMHITEIAPASVGLTFSALKHALSLRARLPASSRWRPPSSAFPPT